MEEDLKGLTWGDWTDRMVMEVTHVGNLSLPAKIMTLMFSTSGKRNPSSTSVESIRVDVQIFFN